MDNELLWNALRALIPPLDAVNEKNQLPVYVPLNEHRHTFRLALLYPGKVPQAFRCSFFEVPFEAAPNYIAVSYTWGDSTKTSAIWTNYGCIKVTMSLDSVLRRLRHPKRFVVIWIDGICINQEDYEEKSRQVQLMREIYANATKTFIYLGEEADCSSQIPQIFERIQIATEKAGYWEPGMTGFRTSGAIKIWPTNYQQFGLPERNDPSWRALGALFARPWFQRIWIIQEAIVSESATVFCGSWSMEFQNFLYTLAVAVISDMPIPGSSTSSSGIATKMAWLMNLLRQAQDEGKKWKLIDLLHRCRTSSATDARDYVYGLLGLSADADEQALSPDYGEHVTGTYLRYASHFINGGDGIQVLYNAGSTISGMPSWVPDWSDKTGPGFRLCGDPNAELSTPFAYAAGSQCDPWIHPSNEHPHVLHVRGILVDVVSELAPPVGRVVNNAMLAIAQLVRELRDMIVEAKMSHYVPSDIDTMSWKTMIANRKKGYQGSAGPEFADYFRAFNLAMTAVGRNWPTTPPTLEDLRDPKAVSAKSYMFVSGAVAVCQKRLRGITNKGFPGQFPLSTLEDDIVFIPCGSALPFAIRRSLESASEFH
jgi:hypothetical protein